ncbi:MAG: hypothetical protein NT007_18180 [Candidatus Kapabacteria bacterium]|nr:hypothetical protein [Candidatus Kapabacteria bacterium]
MTYFQLFKSVMWNQEVAAGVFIRFDLNNISIDITSCPQVPKNV